MLTAEDEEIDTAQHARQDTTSHVTKRAAAESESVSGAAHRSAREVLSEDAAHRQQGSNPDAQFEDQGEPHIDNGSVVIKDPIFVGAKRFPVREVYLEDMTKAYPVLDRYAHMLCPCFAF